MDRHQVWRAIKKTASATGKAALGIVGAVAAVWVIGEGIRRDAEEREDEERQKPPILAEFQGREDTFTASFMPNGPWQLSWTGALKIEVWRKDSEEATLYDRASGVDGSTFFSEAGEFYLVVRLLEPGPWHITIRSR
jgi:hypothetical protein